MRFRSVWSWSAEQAPALAPISVAVISESPQGCWPQPYASGMAATCATCGAEVPDGANFCPACGTSVVSTLGEVRDLDSPAAEDVAAGPGAPEGGKKSGCGPWAIAAAVIVLLLVFAFPDDGGDPPAADDGPRTERTGPDVGLAASRLQSADNFRYPATGYQINLDILIALCGRTEEFWADRTLSYSRDNGVSASDALYEVANLTEDPATGRFPPTDEGKAERCVVAAGE